MAKIMDRALDMEVPLTESMEFAHALHMIGAGMVAYNIEEGRPVAAVAGALSERLDALKSLWDGIIKAVRRQTEA